jgi:hypothetical protein
MTYKVSDEHGTREATEAENEIIDIMRAGMAAQAAAVEAQAATRASALTKLADLGLTDDEVRALLG